MKTCNICLKEKPLSEYYARSARCKLCHNEYTKQHYLDNKDAYVEKAQRNNAVYYARNRDWLTNFLSAHACEVCGNDDIEVLEFDHLDRELKDSEVAKLMTGSLERLVAEVAKCRVLCANCHRKHTRRQMGYWYNTTASVPPIELHLNMQMLE